ncbi:hypothetical protein Tco_1174900 [Tanacetum coccineum]
MVVQDLLDGVSAKALLVLLTRLFKKLVVTCLLVLINGTSQKQTTRCLMDCVDIVRCELDTVLFKRHLTLGLRLNVVIRVIILFNSTCLDFKELALSIVGTIKTSSLKILPVGFPPRQDLECHLLFYGIGSFLIETLCPVGIVLSVSWQFLFALRVCFWFCLSIGWNLSAKIPDELDAITRSVLQRILVHPYFNNDLRSAQLLLSYSKDIAFSSQLDLSHLGSSSYMGLILHLSICCIPDLLLSSYALLSLS